MAACVAFSLVAGAASAAYADLVTVNRIADLEFNHGEVVETAEYLADRIGGRLTNSPAMRTAERWTAGKFTSWGLKDVRAEGFDFGRGWWIESAHVAMLTPRSLELHAIPIAWTPATAGPIDAPVIVAPLSAERDLADWRGKLAGKIVLVSAPNPPKDDVDAPFQRLTEAEIVKLDKYKEPVFDPDAKQKLIERLTFRRKLDDFLATEGALGWAQMSRSNDDLVHGEGSGFHAGKTPKLPAVEIAAEDYRRLARLAKTGEVRLRIDSRVHFEDADHNAYNILGDIPGRDTKAGYVMAGAHLDSWVAGDGAADNGAGVAVVMEAARILSALGVHPRRSIRFALWSGEEQGLLGSAAYVEKHLAHRPAPSDSEIAELGPYFASDTFPVTTLPGFDEMDAYFNIDNGSGKIRGIYAEGNFAATPILREFLAPFVSLGAVAVVAEPTGSTDHVFMSKLGLPAFQFIQDPLDYESRVHHTNLDTFDHLRADDLRQAAVILATVLLEAAERDTPLPRNVLPTQPKVSDPFHYPDPAKR
jgi:Zn-dependent M28 family amino/carboxypeptidase